LDGAAPHDGVAGSSGLRGWLGERICGSLLGTDLLIDLIAQLFGELHLRCSAVPAVDEGTFIFAMKKRVTTGTDAGTHYFEG